MTKKVWVRNGFDCLFYQKVFAQNKYVNFNLSLQVYQHDDNYTVWLMCFYYYVITQGSEFDIDIDLYIYY